MKDLLKPAVVLFAVTCAASGMIAVASALTSGIIAENEARAKTEAISAVLPDELDTSRLSVETITGGKYTYHEYLTEAGQRSACVIEIETNGYGGKMKIVVGLDAEGVVTGVDIVSHSETPGLGDAIEKPKFIDQFLGKSGELTLVKQGANDTTEIDAVSAATISSKAVTNAVNDALEFYEETVREGAK